MSRLRFVAVPDPTAERLFPIAMPGKFARRRRDRRSKAAKPDEPLVFYFTQAQLVELRASVARALLMMAGRRDRA